MEWRKQLPEMQKSLSAWLSCQQRHGFQEITDIISDLKPRKFTTYSGHINRINQSDVW